MSESKSTTRNRPSPESTPSILRGAADIAAIDKKLEVARAKIGTRISAPELQKALDTGTLVVDIRPAGQRHRDGELVGAVVIERNVLEWRLDPTSPNRLTKMDDPAKAVVIVCDEGYASSLAATSLGDLGLTNVTDLQGGYQAWRTFLTAKAVPALADGRLPSV